MDDLISRQAAIDAICCNVPSLKGNVALVAKTMEIFADRIKALPSAQPDSSVCWGCNCPKMERRTDGQTD